MLSSVIDTFLNLDEDNKDKVINIISKVITPIKIYLILIILLLIIMCVSNYYIGTKLNALILQKEI